MSVEELAAVIERILASRPVHGLHEAAGCLDEARVVLGQLAQGSTAVELVTAVDGLGHAIEELAVVRQSCDRLAELLRAYLVNLGVAAPTPARPVRPAPAAPERAPVSLSGPDPVLLAEVRRQGHKISPELVVRMARARDQRVVWLEEGDSRSGLGHIMKQERVLAFEGAGIPKNRIVDVVFDALTKGTPVGYSGTDRLVYEVEVEGAP